MAINLILGRDYTPLLHSQSRFDMEVDQAVIVTALEKQQEREAANRENLAIEITNRLGPYIANAIGQMLKALR